MPKEKLRALIAPLCEADRQMLREILDEMLAQEDNRSDGLLAEVGAAPPANLPRDFGINLDHSMDSARKREDRGHQ